MRHSGFKDKDVEFPRSMSYDSPKEEPRDATTETTDAPTETSEDSRSPNRSTDVRLTDARSTPTRSTQSESHPSNPHLPNVLSTPRRLIKAMRESRNPETCVNPHFLNTNNRQTYSPPRSISLPQALNAQASKPDTNQYTTCDPKVVRSRTEPRLQHFLAQDDTETLAIRKTCTPVEDVETEDVEVEHASAESAERSTSAASLSTCTLPSHTHRSTHAALSDPDILNMIFTELDNQTVIPHELVQQRRKPLSLRHAQLIFGKTQRAIDAWQRQIPTTTESEGSGLFNCLFVNKTWHDAAVKILDKTVHFKSTNNFIQFARRGVQSLSRSPQTLVLHKLNDATQVELEMLNPYNLGKSLKWLEFYTCPGISPPASLLGPQLTKIVLPGSSRVTDLTLVDIAENCPQLRHLDIRACDKVSDSGIKIIARYCPKLELLNVGRTSGGQRITYKAVKHIARLTQISTIGLAGCNIDDRAIWELALNRGAKLHRMSLNSCRLLTDASVPRVLGYMPNLTVLEIRGCLQITNLRPVAAFKMYRERRGQPLLIEGCEVIERRLQLATARHHRERINRTLADLTMWVNMPSV